MSNLALRKLGSFVALSEQDRQTPSSHAQRIPSFEAREDLIRDGEDPHCVNLILEGWTCRYKQLADGRRQIISFFVPGDMCDPIVYLLHKMSHSLGSLTPPKVARLNRDEMNALMAAPALAKAIWLEARAAAEIQREWTISLGRRSANERLAHLFCEVPTRLKLVGLSDGAECEFPATQADLADALGLSAVHISRTLRELRGSGLVELKGKRLKIYNQGALQRLAKFDPTYLHLPDP